MGLFTRGAAASVTLSPEGPYRATDAITVSVDVGNEIDNVVAAKVELGYLNVFRYRWAGRNDAVMKHDNNSVLTMGQVGTDYGSERDGREWVHVLEESLPVAGGVLSAGSHRVAVRLPSWSPGSSKEVVQWQIRLRVERGGRDVEVDIPLRVLIAAPDPVPLPTDLPLIQGERAIANDLEFEIETERACYRPGDEVRGIVAVTPRKPVTRTAIFAAWFQRMQESHPVEKTPGSATDAYTRPMVTIVKDVQLVQHQRTEVPFALPLPSDVDPTTEAVHSSINWFVQIKVEFSGATGAIERAQRGIVVYTA